MPFFGYTLKRGYNFWGKRPKDLDAEIGGSRIQSQLFVVRPLPNHGEPLRSRRRQQPPRQGRPEEEEDRGPEDPLGHRLPVLPLRQARPQPAQVHAVLTGLLL